MLVARDVADRDELVREATRRVGRSPTLLRLKCEGVLVLPRHAEALGDVLAGLAHRLGREQLLELRVCETPAERRVVERTIAARERLLGLRRHERRAAHRLLAARDEEIAVARDHGMARADDGGETGGAEPIDGHACGRLGKPSEECGHPRDVAVVLAGLVGGAEPDVLDLLCGDARARDRLADHQRREIVGPDAGKRTAVTADRGPDR